MTSQDCNPAHQIGYHRPHRRGLFAKWARFRAIARSRQTLAHLDDTQLNDIGLTRSEALAEAARPAWDAPDHWFD